MSEAYSPWHTSLCSQESSDEDAPRKKKKKVPAWASSEHLRMYACMLSVARLVNVCTCFRRCSCSHVCLWVRRALKKQSSMRGTDPDTIFPSIPDTCDLLGQAKTSAGMPCA